MFHNAVKAVPSEGVGLPSGASTTAVPGSHPHTLPRPPPPQSVGGRGPSVTQPSSHRAWSRFPKAPWDSFCAAGVRAPGEGPAPPLLGARSTEHRPHCGSSCAPEDEHGTRL